ncbi:Rieske (2Fe-2S) protein [Nocardioides carbamazepini]|uniref:Rieske (2Fe-2S) protein n=1 Tax=Nocardioides carbamazepini TaxID=2854259 RepID=UPI002149CB94|nr:Rieske (2Fe-2S) protein [Nocardioides carbamazepini]MCR1782952.1 Rieske (2Fe-2S) protein [Nocardioides carbamazepini]
MTSSVSRRRALTGVATLGVGVPLLAACGDDGASSADDPVTADPTSPPPSSDPASSTTTTPPAEAGLVAAADVPVGGGVVLNDEEIVVTQPTAGEFKAFTAVCTHQGCLVGSVSDGAIHCPCHDSSFSATDGSVEGGPANGPLAEVAVTVADGQVRRS